MKPETISGAFRYSNWPYNTGGFLTGTYESTGGLTGGLSGGGGTSTSTTTSTSSSSSGWTNQNTVDVVTTAASFLQNVLTSIWGHNNQWQTQAYNTMYQQERRTNTILWVVIGLVVALGLFLVIRKTK